MVGFDQVWCVCVYCRFPCVITIGVSFPMDQILQGPVAPEISMIVDLLHFILFLIIDQVRWWPGEVWAVCHCFVIG